MVGAVSWDHAFLAELQRDNPRRRYVLDSVGGVGYVPGSSSVWLSTHDEGAFHLPIIARSGHTFRAGSLQPGEWSSTLSELSIRLTRGWAYALSGAARGQLYQLRMGFWGWKWSDYAPIFSGRIVGIRQGTEGDWFLELRSVPGMLVSRATQAGLQTAIFYDLPQNGTTLATAIPAGAASGTTFRVVSGAGIASETSGRYLVEITPDSGDPYLLECSNFNAGTLTYTISGAVFGATIGAAKIGNDVRALAYVKDHPVDVVKKIITSTGAGTNGAYDTLPAAWGVGLPWSLLNLDDMDATKQVLNTGTAAVSASWRVYSADPQDDGLGWLSSILNPAGLFLTEAEGGLSVRPATNSNGQQLEIDWIDDREIVALDYDVWSPAAVVEYSRLRVTSPSGDSSSSEPLNSLPAALERTGALPYLDASEITWRLNVLERAVGWSTRLPESVTLTLMGLSRARLAPGSGLGIRSRRLESRNTSDDLWMVTSCEPDWFGTSIRVQASRIPNSEPAP